MVAALLAASGVAAWFAFDRPSSPPVSDTLTVQRVVDGDTVVLSDGRKVRVVGINTPEHGEALAGEARQFTSDFVLGKAVVPAPSGGKTDAYGRTLADLQVDGASLAEAILRSGLAHVMLIPPYDEGEARRLLDAESSARKGKRGIWTDARFAGPLHVTSLKVDRGGRNACHMRVANVSGEDVPLAGYSIRGAGGDPLGLPAVVLPPGRTVLVRCGNESDRLAGGREQVQVG